MRLHKHHKLPKYKGGTDDKSNIVLLTPENHAKLHLLRYHIFGDIRELGAYYALKGMTLEARKLSLQAANKALKDSNYAKLKELGKRSADWTSKEYIVTSPAGCEIKVKNLRKFCRDYGFSRRCFKNQLNGFTKNPRNKWRIRNAV